MPVDETQLRTETVEIGTHINCYRNLNLLKYGVVGWSIQQRVKRPGKKPSMLVVQHAKCVLLSNVTFKPANEKQVHDVMTDCRKVCAWLKGTYQGSCISRSGFESNGTWKEPTKVTGLAKNGIWRRLRCDPKKGRGDFYDDKTRETITAAKFVFVDSDGAAWYVAEEANAEAA